MGTRGPKPEVVLKLSAEERVELDAAIVEGKATKADLHVQFGEPHGISYRAFCTYAVQLESRAKSRYVGELINQTFGNLTDSDIDARSRGVALAMLDRLAVDVMQDGDVKPRDLREVIQSIDIVRRGAIADAGERRKQAEYDAVRMGAVAEAAVWMQQELQRELADDPVLAKRLLNAVDRYAQAIDKPADDRMTATLLGKLAKRFNWKHELRDMVQRIWGVDIGGEVSQPVAKRTEDEIDRHLRSAAQDIYGIDPPLTSAGQVYDEIDRIVRGTSDADTDQNDSGKA